MREEEDLEVMLDGKGATLATVEPRAALDLARAYLGLFDALAEDEGAKPGLHGLVLKEGSTIFAIKAARSRDAKRLSVRAARIMRGAEVPPERVEPAARRLREVLLSLPSDYSARVKVAGFAAPLLPEPNLAELGAWETVELRAKLIIAGGVEPFARFQSPSEPRSFILKMRKELVTKLSPFLYRDMDIVATVSRDQKGVIAEGTLESFELVDSDLDDFAAWQEWYRESGGAEWDAIEDLESELGRVRS